MTNLSDYSVPSIERSSLCFELRPLQSWYLPSSSCSCDEEVLIFLCEWSPLGQRCVEFWPLSKILFSALSSSALFPFFLIGCKMPSRIHRWLYNRRTCFCRGVVDPGKRGNSVITSGRYDWSLSLCGSVRAFFKGGPLIKDLGVLGQSRVMIDGKAYLLI